MYIHDYWNDTTKKRMEIRTEKKWEDLSFDSNKIILIKSKIVEDFNPNLPPPEPPKKELEKRFNEVFEDG